MHGETVKFNFVIWKAVINFYGVIKVSQQYTA
jgi:hypothetical protein